MHEKKLVIKPSNSALCIQYFIDCLLNNIVFIKNHIFTPTILYVFCTIEHVAILIPLINNVVQKACD